MDIATTYSATGTPTSQKAATQNADYQTFLKMLTVQMQNQDPLNPIDSTDYAVQLATFSGVEQQVVTNQLLAAMGGQFSLMGMSQLAGWVGQEARAAADVWYSGAPVTLSPNPVSGVERAVLVVTDDTGTVVSREDIPVGTAPYQWLGGDAVGDPLPEGRYSLTLESWKNGEVVQQDPVEYYGRVVEAQGGATGTMLVFEGGIQVPASKITALRMADA